MNAIDIACNLAKQFEGFSARPYTCPAGVPTIGYGSTRYLDGKSVTLQDNPITKEQAEELLVSVMKKCLNESLVICPNLAEHGDARKAAIADFVYNLGASRLASSTLKKKILAEQWGDVPAELRKWVHAGAVVLPGLKARREAEIMLIISQQT